MNEMVFDARKGLRFHGEGLFFDTCVWLAIYGPDNREHKTCFSEVYAAAQKGGVPVFISDFVISEFHNRSIKIDYRLIYPEDKDFSLFKKRRKQGELFEILDSAKDTCLNIIDECQPALSFNEFDQISQCLSVCAAGELDFTDSVIEAQCARLNLTLVTSDGDYAKSGIPMLTDNTRLLRPAAPKPAATAPRLPPPRAT